LNDGVNTAGQSAAAPQHRHRPNTIIVPRISLMARMIRDRNILARAGLPAYAMPGVQRSVFGGDWRWS
jgi:hypothetical protein